MEYGLLVDFCIHSNLINYQKQRLLRQQEENVHIVMYLEENIFIILEHGRLQSRQYKRYEYKLLYIKDINKVYKNYTRNKHYYPLIIVLEKVQGFVQKHSFGMCFAFILFLAAHIVGGVWYLSFCEWLISLSLMFSRFMLQHMLEFHSFLRVNNTVCLCTTFCVSIHLEMSPWIVCFLAIVNTPAVIVGL